MEYQILKKEITDGIALVTICRPQALNALNTQFFKEMSLMMTELSTDNSVRVLVITGEGKAFVAGADIAEMVNKNTQEGSDFGRVGQQVFLSFEKAHFPIIAAVNGFALGGGLELAMACDFRIANSKAKFGQPEVNLGLIPGFAGTQRLPRLVGTANALFLLMSAEMIGAEEALRIGLVQKVTEPEELLNEALRIAKLIASKGPKAVQLIKKVVREGLAMGFEAGNELEAVHFGSLFGVGSEGEEGMKAFLEKRAPNW
jgi:enoyl-CoA hydratase